MPDLYKIGRTVLDVHERATQLSRATGVPLPFRVICYIETDDASRDEAQLHNFLADFRVNFDREFFRFKPIHMPWVFGLFEYHPRKLYYSEVWPYAAAEGRKVSEDPENPWDWHDYREPKMTRYAPAEAWDIVYLD